MAAFAAIDNFDSYADGDLTLENGGSGWAAAWVCDAAYDVQGTTVFKGAKAVTVVNATDSRSGTRLMSDTVDSGDMYFAMRDNGGDNSSYGSIQIRSTIALGLNIQFRDTGAPKALTANDAGGVNTLLTPISYNVWYIIHVQFLSSTTCKVRYKAAGGTFSAFTGTLTYSNSVTSPSTIGFDQGDNSGATSNAFFFDEIGTTDPDAAVTATAGPNPTLLMLGVG